MRQSLETGGPGKVWRAPECPFTIEWPAHVMEQIRAAAKEALFSLPHGGAEIGGVFWGTRAAGRVRILAARPLECEYALGPTFTLSGKDHARLAALLDDGPDAGLDDARGDPGTPGWEPVGWYHSHTRGEILLSARDVEIHNRYFPDPWQVALVVRPHSMQPMRAGFFFREANGSIHADASYCEFLLEPVVGEQTVSPAASPAGASFARRRVQGGPRGPGSPPHRNGHSREKRSWWWLCWVAIVLGMAAVVFAFKHDWAIVFTAGRPSVVLMAYDINGQLRIRWDWAAESIRSAEAGSVEIKDGATRTVVELDKPRLRGGTVSYERIGARIDVRLAVRQPGGRVYEEYTSFIGRAGQPGPNASTGRLRRELEDQAARVHELEQAVAGLQETAHRGPPQR